MNEKIFLSCENCGSKNLQKIPGTNKFLCLNCGHKGNLSFHSLKWK
jgi:hypothetical protein